MKRGVIIFVLLVLSISYISAATTFFASNVSVKIDGTDRTLQYAIDYGLFKGTHTYASATLTAIGQHDASQILVNVNGVEKTLLAALSSGTEGLCGSGSYSTYNLSSIPNPGHTAIEVILSDGKINLQAKINTGIFCINSYSWSGIWSSTSCPTTYCGGTLTQSYVCLRSDGVKVADSFCPQPKPADYSRTCSCKWQTNPSFTETCGNTCLLICPPSCGELISTSCSPLGDTRGCLHLGIAGCSSGFGKWDGQVICQNSLN